MRGTAKEGRRRLATIMLAGALFAFIFTACGSPGSDQRSADATSTGSSGAVVSIGPSAQALQSASPPAESPLKEPGSPTPAHSGHSADDRQTAKPEKQASQPPSAEPAKQPEKQPEKTAEPKPTGQPTPKPTSTPAEDNVKVHVVEIKDFAFSPAKLEIKSGDTVKFINRDSVRHTATADSGLFDTGLLGKDEAKQVTFNDSGEISYYCAPHPGMKAVIIVRGK